VDRPASRDGPAAAVVRTAAGDLALRDLTRTRLQLLKDRMREWQRLGKLLEGADQAVLGGLLHGQEQDGPGHPGDIAAGERDPKVLAARAHGNIKGGSSVIEQAL
jgi:hypothetical protein